MDDELGPFPDSCSLDTGPDAEPTAEYAAARGDSLQRMARDRILIDDRSYMAPELQQWIFDQLSTGSPGGFEVYGGNLSYTVNAKRKLASSDETELQSKAYIVDKHNPRASKPTVYIEARWQGKKTRPATPPLAERKDGKRPRQRPKPLPPSFKVSGFYRVTGEALRKIELLAQAASQEKRRVLAKLEEHNFTPSEMGAVLYIVLPSSYECSSRMSCGNCSRRRRGRR
jgi:hypothetical protein